MRPVLYLFVNQDLRMSAGKIAAQAAQATAGAIELSDDWLYEFWFDGPGQHHTVYVMHADDTVHLYSIERYLQARNFKTFMMIDEGMTEVLPITPTVLGVEIVNKDDAHVEASFMAFKLYKDKKPPNSGKSRKTRWFRR